MGEKRPLLDWDRSYGIAPLTSGPLSPDEYAASLDANLWRPPLELKVPIDTSPAGWIAEAICPGTFEVRMTVPERFDAYARIFFPIVGDPVLREGRQVDNERLTWSEVARRNGKVPHALMEAETISSAPGRRPALYGCFGEEQENVLWTILERHTASRTGWFLLWDGFGGLDPRPFQGQSKVEHPGRAYHLLHGLLSARDSFANAPSYIWPDDRAWCLTQDTDFYWAYIAGTSACVEEIVATSIIDAYLTTPTSPARSGMDIINDPHRAIPRHP